MIYEPSTLGEAFAATLFMSSKGNFYCGTSGLVVTIPQSKYPPEFAGKSRLEYYASRFNSIEINSSFYKLPNAKTIAKWVALVPDHFRFTFKLSKTISHVKKLAFREEDIAAFMQAIAPANDKQGCLLVQFPPSIKIELLNEFHELLQSIDAANDAGWKIAVEFRHASWYEREVYELLDEFNCSMVLQDIPASATPFIRNKEKCKYLRFHGPGGKYRGSYEAAVLKTYASHIIQWRKAGKEVYCYFNNTMGSAVTDLEKLVAMVSI